MTDLPEPLTPPDCDLRGYDYMPFHGHQLFGSVFWAESSDEERVAAIQIWWAAWLQSPSASLPDNDKVLAQLAGYGRDLEGWRRVKERVMHGFIPCSDGRLYHRFLSKQAVIAFELRSKNETKRKGDRERLRAWRESRGSNTAEWEKLRQEVFHRDGHQCTHCGSRDKLYCDYIRPVRDGGDNSLGNLTTLCNQCHSRKTANSAMPASSGWRGCTKASATDTNTDTKPEIVSNPTSEMDTKRSSSRDEMPFRTATVAVEVKRSEETISKKESKKEPPTLRVVPPQRRTQIKPDWQPTEAGHTFASTNRVVDIEREAAKFRDYHLAKGSTMADWNAAWRTWCSRSRAYEKPAIPPVRNGFLALQLRAQAEADEQDRIAFQGLSDVARH